MFLRVFEPWSLRGNALKRRLEDSKTPRLEGEQTIPSGGIEEVVRYDLGSRLSARSADRFERFIIQASGFA